MYPTAYYYVKKYFSIHKLLLSKMNARIINVEAFFSRTIMGVQKCNFKINSIHVQNLDHFARGDKYFIGPSSDKGDFQF